MANLNGLQTLLALQQQTPPPVSDEDAQLSGYISDEDVSDMQDADLAEQEKRNASLGRDPFTNEARGTLSLTSAYDTKQQALTGLKRTLGMDRAKTGNQIAVQNASASNAMALEKQREGSAERIAATNAQTQNERIRAQQAFQADQNEKGRAATSGRTAATQDNVNARAAATLKGSSSRQASAQAEARAKALEAQAAKVGGLNNMFTGGRDKLLKQAAELRSGALQQNSKPGVSDIAQQYITSFPGVSGDQLMQVLKSEQPTASPEELQSLYSEILSAQQ